MDEKNMDEKMDHLKKIVIDLLNDILTTFPEYKNELNTDLVNILNNNENSDTSISSLFEYFKLIYPDKFFDILYQNEEVFSKEDVDCHFLPGIDFKLLWKENISENTRNTIWKYLQLISFTIVTSISDGSSFGDTSKIFEEMNGTDFKDKLDETLNKMKDMFSDNECINNDNLPKTDDIHEHINNMMEGKLGKLARDIAEETSKELDIDLEGSKDVNDVFNKLLKNPTQLMNMVNKVGNKLDEKLKSGDINETELMEEASLLVNKMKNMPGMNDIASMLSKMGMSSGKNKLNTKAMTAHMERGMKVEQNKERLRQKLEQRKVNQENNMDKKHMVFSKGEKVEKSYKTDNNIKKNKKKKKKKNKK